MSIIDNLFNGWAKKNVPFGYETFKDENLKIISSMLDELKITLIQQKAVNK